jgi:hypothetical protein
MAAPDPLLPPDALSAVRIGISASESHDLGRLGLVETHFRLAIGELARSVLVGGGKLAYGGHLHPDGYTNFLMNELQRYGRRDRPLRVCLDWTQHREVALEILSRSKIELGLLGEIVCLDDEGEEVDPSLGRGPEPVHITDRRVQKRSLTGLRRYMAKNTTAQVLIGGRNRGYRGRLPGVVEEATIAIQQEKPIYLAGGFGGATLEIIRAIRPEHASWLPSSGEALNPETAVALEALSDLRREALIDNGLTQAENARLAASQRPSEIATLVSLGLGRRFRSE